VTTDVTTGVSAALTTTERTAVAPPFRFRRLLYNPLAWLDWFRWASERIYRAHTEFDYAAIAPHIADGATVLDVGAWDGRLSRLLADRKGCRPLLVDVVDKNRSGLPFRRFDGERLPLAAGERFDVVQLLYVLHHAADDAVLLAEARRALAPGGTLLVAEDLIETPLQRAITVGFHVWLLAFTFMGWRGSFRRIAAWRRRFADAGFEVEAVLPLGAHMGNPLMPRNVLFRLRATADQSIRKLSKAAGK
jgi:SAM-dependent methyltransferase